MPRLDQDKNWGVLEVNHLEGYRKIDNLGENGQNQLWINKLRSSTTFELDRGER